MKHVLRSLLGFGLLSIGILGCAEKSTTTKETTVTTPEGQTKVTVTKEVEQTGENPPAPVQP